MLLTLYVSLLLLLFWDTRGHHLRLFKRHVHYDYNVNILLVTVSYLIGIND